MTRPKLDGKVTWVATPKLNIGGRIGWLHYNMDNPPVSGESGGVQVASAGGRAGNAFGRVASRSGGGNMGLAGNVGIVAPGRDMTCGGPQVRTAENRTMTIFERISSLHDVAGPASREASRRTCHAAAHRAKADTRRLTSACGEEDQRRMTERRR